MVCDNKSHLNTKKFFSFFIIVVDVNILVSVKCRSMLDEGEMSQIE